MPKADDFFGLSRRIEAWVGESLGRGLLALVASLLVLAPLILSVFYLLLV